MHRLGFEEKDMEQVVEILNDQTVVIARSVFSHFAGSDEKRFDDYSHRQIETFSRCADYLQQHSKHKILRHILKHGGNITLPRIPNGYGKAGYRIIRSLPYRHTLRAGNSQHIENNYPSNQDTVCRRNHRVRKKRCIISRFPHSGNSHRICRRTRPPSGKWKRVCRCKQKTSCHRR